MVNLLKKLNAVLNLIRPIGWAPFLFSLAFGLTDAGGADIVRTLIAFSICGPLCLGGVYILNFYFDREVDKLNPLIKDVKMSFQPFSTGEISSPLGMILMAALLASGLLLAWQINIQFFSLTLLAWLIGVLYSVPPIRLKSRPLFDVLTNSFSCGLICYVAGWAAVIEISRMSLLQPLWLSLFVASTYILTLIVDIDADRKAGVNTTAVYLGIKRSVQVGFALLVLSCLFLVLSFVLVKLGILYLLMLIVFYPFGIAGYWKLYKQACIERAYKLAKRAVQCSIIMILVFLIFTSLT